MKVKLLTSRVGAGVENHAGDIVDLDPREARVLLERGQAAPVAERREQKAERRVRRPTEARG